MSRLCCSHYLLSGPVDGREPRPRRLDEEDEYEEELRRAAAEAAAANGDRIFSNVNSQEEAAALEADMRDGKLSVHVFDPLLGSADAYQSQEGRRSCCFHRLWGRSKCAAERCRRKSVVVLDSSKMRSLSCKPPSPSALHLVNIPSSHQGSPLLGSLVVGDTICVGSNNGTKGPATAFNMTGGAIPYLRSWVCRREEGQSVVELKRRVSRASVECGLGIALHDSELRRSTLLFGGAFDDGKLSPKIANAQVRFFEKGIMISIIEVS